MPRTKSVLKSLNVSKRKREKNLRTKNKYKKSIKGVRKDLAKGDISSALENLKTAYKNLDLAAKKKTIHKNKASRLKSRLAKAINKKEGNESGKSKKTEKTAPAKNKSKSKKK